MSSQLQYRYNSFSVCGKGVVYAKIQLPTQPTSHLHVFNTQLQASEDPYNYRIYSPAEETINTRARQMQQLKRFMDDQLVSLVVGNESDVILLAGDFHVNGRRGPDGSRDSEEYQILKRILEGNSGVSSGSKEPAMTESNVGSTVSLDKDALQVRLRDVVREALGEHPVTVGDVLQSSRRPLESQLTPRNLWGVCASIDYIFQVNVVGVETVARSAPYIDLEDTHVERFRKYIPGLKDLAVLSNNSPSKAEEAQVILASMCFHSLFT